jgi:prepilin-type N-terminal cleavage/methylation domain-containing protein
MGATKSHRQTSLKLPTGFTLVELVIVVLILGILGTIAAAKATYSYEDSIRVTLQANLDTIYDAIDVRRGKSLPATIDPTWFRGRKLPRHPQAAASVSAVQVATDIALFDPANKVLSGTLAPYWYNSANGEVRVRVGVVDTEAETLEFYNAVNGTNVTSLGNYVAGTKAASGESIK